MKILLANGMFTVVFSQISNLAFAENNYGKQKKIVALL
ncbi:MAG: hypothetical protein ACI9Y1_002445 [Lentisphaeria bacterium]|jgi:hypothetical protein